MTKRKDSAQTASSFEQFKNFLAVLKPFANDEFKNQIIAFEVLCKNNIEEFQGKSLLQIIKFNRVESKSPFDRLDIMENGGRPGFGHEPLMTYLSQNLNIEMISVINEHFEQNELFEIHSIFFQKFSGPIEVKIKIVENLLELSEIAPMGQENFLREIYQLASSKFENDDFSRIKTSFLKIDNLPNDLKEQLLQLENVHECGILINELNREQALKILPQIQQINGLKPDVKAKISEKYYKIGLPFQAVASYFEKGVLQQNFVDAFEQFEY